MKCELCGRELEEGSRFCSGCGAYQTDFSGQKPPAPAAPKPKKERKPAPKGLLPAIAIVAAVAIAAAVLIPMLLPKKETVYVLRDIRFVHDGETIYRAEDMDYDAFGNPLRDYRMLNLFQANGRSAVDAPELECDDRGNPTQVLALGGMCTLEYTYDSKGRIQRCVQTFEERENWDPVTWEFTWDKAGRLTQVISDAPGFFGNSGGVCRADFEYDREGRLVRECFYGLGIVGAADGLRGETVRVFEYTYNKDGNVESVDYGWAEHEDPSQDAEAPKCYELLHMDYDREGRLEELEYYPRQSMMSFLLDPTGDAQQSTLELRYDRQGNLKSGDWADLSYDDQGNLEKIRMGNITLKMEYEALEMTRDRARRYRRWERMMLLDPKEFYTDLWNALSAIGHPATDAGTFLFFYYLIPNPVW